MSEPLPEPAVEGDLPVDHELREVEKEVDTVQGEEVPQSPKTSSVGPRPPVSSFGVPAPVVGHQGWGRRGASGLDLGRPTSPLSGVVTDPVRGSATIPRPVSRSRVFRGRGRRT